MKKYISIFFAGTAHPITSEFLAGYLYEHTDADDETHFKQGFNGCGVDYGINGGLFATGLDEQCNEVISDVHLWIAEGFEVVLNVYGHSRGGMAAIMLAQQLSLVNPKKLEINLALMDPVPGNLIVSANLDPFDTTLANKGMDLTDCKPLKNVLALYPYEPLPDLVFHAPIFISYPSHIKPEEIVVPGCHAGAEITNSFDTTVTASLVMKFLSDQGTKLKALAISQKSVLSCYDGALKKLNKHGSKERDAHSAQGIYIDAQKGATFFNEHHRQLANGKPNARLAVSLKKSNNPFSLMKRTAGGRIFTGVLKWALLGLGLAALLYFTGGLAAIPFLASAITSMGALSILAAAPVLASGLSLIWYGFIKPIVSFLLHRFLYPQYSLRDITYQGGESYNNISEFLEEAKLTNDELLKNPAINEMFTTEFAYNKVLSTLLEGLNKSELVGKNQTLLALRELVRDLEHTSNSLLANSRKGIQEKSSPKVRNDLRVERGELLKSFFQILLRYAPLYNKCMEEQKENPKGFKALNEYFKAQVYEDGRKGLDLAAHLIAPIQRGPKYKLLIQEIHKIGTNLDDINFTECKEQLDLIENNLNILNQSLSGPSKASASKNDGCWPFWSSEQYAKQATPAPTHFAKPF